jgi:hypothetical protein
MIGNGRLLLILIAAEYLHTTTGITLNSECMDCGVRNTFGVFVYFKEYTFPLLLYLQLTTKIITSISDYLLETKWERFKFIEWNR